MPATFWFFPPLVKSNLSLSDKLSWTFCKQIMNIILLGSDLIQLLLILSKCFLLIREKVASSAGVVCLVFFFGF